MMGWDWRVQNGIDVVNERLLAGTGRMGGLSSRSIRIYPQQQDRCAAEQYPRVYCPGSGKFKPCQRERETTCSHSLGSF